MPTIDDLHQKQSKAIFRSHLHKIVEIYDVEWRVLHELIQNAIDATQANAKVDKGEVEIILDFDKDSVQVSDNGIGFPHDLQLLVPGGTGKEKRLSSRSPAKGYQGVGLKAVMYSTKSFVIESQTEDLSWTFKADRLCEYIAPDNGGFTPEYTDRHTRQESESTYTKITAHFPEGMLGQVISGLDRFLGEDSIKWQGLYYKQRNNLGSDPFREYATHFLSWYFRTQSYVGCVNALINIEVRNPLTEKFESLKPATVKLRLKSSRRFLQLSGKFGGWLQGCEEEVLDLEIPYRAWDYAEIAETNAKLEAKYRIAPDLITMKPSDPDWDRLRVTFRDKFLDLKLRPNTRAEGFRERFADFIAILERPRSKVRAEDYEDVLGKITGIYLAIGRTASFELLGLSNHGTRIIASNGTPTSHELAVRSTSSTWYLETIHMIINVDATLNVGKRHLANMRLVGRVNEFFEACYPALVQISKLFVERDTSGPQSDPMPDVFALQRLRRVGISFRRFPNDESSLTGIFCSAMATLDPDFSIYGLFSRARYDGKFLWLKNEPASDAGLSRLEFKVRLDDLLAEFDSATHDKEFKDIHLIVVWDRRQSKPGWTVKGISNSKRLNLERMNVPTDLVQYVLEDGYGNFLPLICVADLLLRMRPLEGVEGDDLEEFVTSMG